jgi:hypothetical protein
MVKKLIVTAGYAGGLQCWTDYGEGKWTGELEHGTGVCVNWQWGSAVQRAGDAETAADCVNVC